MQQNLQPVEQVPNPLDSRIIKTPSVVARRAFFYVQECGHLKASGAQKTSRQDLPSYLFAVVLDGQGVLTYEGRTERLSAGDCFFIDCRQHHVYQSDTANPWELLWVHFNGCTSDEYYKLYAAQLPPVFHPAASAKFVSLLQELLRTNTETYADTEVISSGLLAQLLTMLLTANSLPEESESALQTKLKVVLAYIDANFTKEIRLDEISKRFYISKYYLTREFKRTYGETIFQHIIGKRVNYAKRLLRFTDKSVEEISELCGFHDQSYFAKQFKKAENTTCLAFRRRWRD